VDHVGPVAKGDSLDHLVDVVAQALGVNSNGVFFEHLEEVLLDILKDEVEAALATRRLEIFR
jgi:hypothetical protein